MPVDPERLRKAKEEALKKMGTMGVMMGTMGAPKPMSTVPNVSAVTDDSGKAKFAPQNQETPPGMDPPLSDTTTKADQDSKPEEAPKRRRGRIVAVPNTPPPAQPQAKKPRTEGEFVFTMADIASLLGMSERGAKIAASSGAFDPSNLKSIFATAIKRALKKKASVEIMDAAYGSTPNSDVTDTDPSDEVTLQSDPPSVPEEVTPPTPVVSAE